MHPSRLIRLLGIAALLAAPAVEGQAPRPVTVMDVRRACVNPDADSTFRGAICSLQLPESTSELRQEKKWTPWLEAFTRDGKADSARARQIRELSSALDEESVPVVRVLGLLSRSDRTALLQRYQSASRNLRGEMLRLEPPDITTLLRRLWGDYHADSALARTVAEAVDSSADSLSARVGPEKAARALLQEVLDALPHDSSLVALAERDPAIQEALFGKLLRDKSGNPVTVADVVRSATSAGTVQLAERLSASSVSPAAGAVVTVQAGSVQSNLLWGFSDFVVGQVEQQLRAYALRGFVHRLCDDVGTQLLPAACEQLRDDDLNLSRPGMRLLRSAVHADLHRLPAGALALAYDRMTEALAASPDSLTDADWRDLDRAETVVRSAVFGLRIAQGSDPLLALAAAADSLALQGAERLRALKAAADRERDSLEARLADPALQPSARERLERGRSAASAAAERLRQRLDDRARLQALRAAHFPVSSLIESLGLLHATQFDRHRLVSVLWDSAGGRDLVRYQAIAMAANLAERNARLPIDQQFMPWRFAAVALAVQPEVAQLRAAANDLAARRAASPDTTAGVRQARIAFVRSGFGLMQRVLLEAERGDWLGDAGPSLQAVNGAHAVVMPLLDGDYPAALLTLRDQVEGMLPRAAGSDALASWSRGMSFVTEIASAQGPDEVSAALATLADGGSGVEAKRESGRNVFTLNAFGGLYAGAVLAGGALGGERAGSEAAAFAGPYIPLGVQYTTPWRTALGTFGIFMQAIDVGALGSWRLSREGDAEVRPEVGLAQVFSPGAFLVLNVRDTPLSVGYGVSYAPGLRRLRSSDEEPPADETAEANARRIGLFLALDIPLFP